MSASPTPEMDYETRRSQLDQIINEMFAFNEELRKRREEELRRFNAESLESAKRLAECRKLSEETLRSCMETYKFAHEVQKSKSESQKLLSESKKLNREATKISREIFWYPVGIALGMLSAVAAATAAIIKILT